MARPKQKTSSKSALIRQVRPTPVTGGVPEEGPVRSMFESEAKKLAGTAFASEEAALSALISVVCDKLANTDAELREFLTLLIETDPALREELVRQLVK